MQIRANASENQVINVNSAARERAEERAGKKAQQQGQKQSIFAGDLGMQGDMIALRRQRAQKKALKIVGDAWNGDRKIDQNVMDIKDKLNLLIAEREENIGYIEEGEAQKEELRLQYGVSADSQEQKDLELLEKKRENQRHPDEVFLTQEERTRLDELDGQPLTEYQERCLNIDKNVEIYKVRNDQIEEELMNGNATIRAIRLERLKYHGMVDAQKKADDVMEAANDEIFGMLVEEGKDHLDEEMEEKREEAKEKAEEKAEQEKKIEEREEKQAELEERIDESKENRDEQEQLRREASERSREDDELLHDMMEAGVGNIGNVSDIQSEIKNILHKMKLLEEDLKGSAVDDQV